MLLPQRQNKRLPTADILTTDSTCEVKNSIKKKTFKVIKRMFCEGEKIIYIFNGSNVFQKNEIQN